MAYIWQRWMADEFRAAGLEVIEVDGWRNRGRPASTGSYDPRHGVTIHHTGATSSQGDPGPTLGTLIAGRSDLPGPLAQWSVRHDGVVVVIAAGRCNHAGKVGKQIPYAALGADGNALFMGDEVDTNGKQEMPAAQAEAIAITNAVYLRHFGLDETRIHRHEDISGTGKWDLGSRTTQQLRNDAVDAHDELENEMKKEDWERLGTMLDNRVKAAMNTVLDQEQSNGRSVKENIRAAGNTREIAAAVAKELGVPVAAGNGGGRP